MKVKDLTKKYGDVTALSSVSFNFDSPCKVGVIGHNGSGKTTMLEILMGIKKPSSGIVDYQIASIKDIKEKVGVILQDSTYYRSIKVHELIRLFASYYKETHDINYLMELLGVNKYQNKFYTQLSGGMRQKVDLLLAFINKPEFVFLDEPTTGLDPLSRKDFWDTLNLLCKDTILFLSSHYMEEVQDNCSGLIYLHDGKLVFAGKIKELLAKENSDSLSKVYIKISGGNNNVNRAT